MGGIFSPENDLAADILVGRFESDKLFQLCVFSGRNNRPTDVTRHSDQFCSIVYDWPVAPPLAMWLGS